MIVEEVKRTELTIATIIDNNDRRQRYTTTIHKNSDDDEDGDITSYRVHMNPQGK